jgi:hypothetical protein
MPNITLNVDQDVVRKVRKIAVDRHTTLTAMVREFLESVAAMDDAERQRAAERLRQSFGRLSRNMGERHWRREDLYER